MNSLQRLKNSISHIENAVDELVDIRLDGYKFTMPHISILSGMIDLLESEIKKLEMGIYPKADE